MGDAGAGGRVAERTPREIVDLARRDSVTVQRRKEKRPLGSLVVPLEVLEVLERDLFQGGRDALLFDCPLRVSLPGDDNPLKL